MPDFFRILKFLDFPDYLDFLVFSFVFEYADATASDLEYIFTDPNGFNILNPTQINEYLILGDSQVIQFGYMTKSGYSLDFIYEQFNPEFDLNLERGDVKPQAILSFTPCLFSFTILYPLR